MSKTRLLRVFVRNEKFSVDAWCARVLRRCPPDQSHDLRHLLLRNEHELQAERVTRLNEIVDRAVGLPWARL